MLLLKKKYFHLVYSLCIVITPFILIFLPINYFDSGESICLSKRIFDVSCYACGLTRSLQHFIHLDFKVAYEFNKLIIVIFPLLVFVYFRALKRILKIIKLEF